MGSSQGSNAENSDKKDATANEKDEADSHTAESAARDAPIQSSKFPNAIENPKPATQEQLAEVKQDLTAFEKATLRWTQTTAGIGFVTALFICLQWCEMHSGSADTHELAVAAVKQAEQTKIIAEQAGKQAEAARALAQQAVTQAAQTTKLAASAAIQANAAKSTAETAADSLIRSQRPWIGVGGPAGVIESGKIEPVGANPQLVTKITFGIQNHGQSPALHLGIWTRPISSKIPIISFSPTEISETCQLAEARSRSSGMVIFPGLTQSTEQLIYSISPNPMLNTELYFVGCISYGDQFHPGVAHHTQFCFASVDVIRDLHANNALRLCDGSQEAN